MDKQLVIIGASAMGRETCEYARQCGIQVKGFIDSRSRLLDGYPGCPPVLGSANEYRVEKSDVFVCAIGDPEQKRKYVAMFPNVCWATIVHPAAYVGARVKLGAGCIICPHATLTTDICLGSHVIVNANASVSHDCSVGNFVSISPGCNIAGWCTVGNDVFLGVGSSLIPHVELGDGVYVAASAVVTQSYRTGRLMGVPAKLK